LAFEVLTVAALGVAFGCGDDEPPSDQAVFWMSLSPAQGEACSAQRTFSLPDESARSVLTGSGQGERLVNGEDDNFVECRVSEGGASGQFDVSFDLSSGEIGSFSARGAVTMTSATEGTGTVDIILQTTSFTLEQDGCTATAKAGLEGAVWFDSVTCPGLVDRRSPGGVCNGLGGFIAENCAR
jgi:hypothetical protein